MRYVAVPFERLPDLGYAALFQPVHITGRTPQERFRVWNEEVRPWCEAEFGPLSGMGGFMAPAGERWWSNGFSIYFETVTDATHFRLRWC